MQKKLVTKRERRTKGETFKALNLSALSLLFFLFLLSFTSASTFGYNYLDGQTVNKGGNYTINVNNTNYLEGHPSSYFATASGYVPYTGASNNVNLGIYNLTSTGMGQFAWTDLLEQATGSTPPADTLRLYVEDSKGFSVYKYIDDTGMVRQLGRDNTFPVKNEGANIPSMTAVYDCGSSGNVPLVCPARANNISTSQDIGITIEPINTGSFGRVMLVGLLENVDTTSFEEGNRLYLSDAVAGGMTTTPPITPNLTVSLGTVLIKGVGNGAIQVLIGEITGDEFGTINNFTVVGNITAPFFIGSGKFLTGLNQTNTSYVPYVGANANVVLGNHNFSVNSTTLFVDTNNSRVGIGTSSPSVQVEVNKSYWGGTNLLMPQIMISNPSTNTTNYGSNSLLSLKAGGVEGWLTVHDSETLGSGFDFRIITNHEFNIWTNDMKRLTIDNSGNVGIGTITPQTKLDIAGTGSQNLLNITDAGVDVLYVNSAGKVGIGDSSPLTKLHINNGDSGMTSVDSSSGLFIEGNTHAGLTIGSGNTSLGALIFADQNSNAVSGIKYNHNTNMLTLESNGWVDTLNINSVGNVGIGTTSPTEELYVSKNQNSETRIQVVNNNWSSNARAGFVISGSNGSIQMESFGNDFSVPYGSNSMLYTSGATNKLFLGTVGAYKMVIDTTGNVGIGLTTAPQQKLHVVGNILANGTINATSDIGTNGNLKVDGNVNITGNLSVKRPYWNGFDNSTQNFLNTSAVQVINISNNNDFDSYGIHVVGSQNLTFDMTGDYLCMLSPEFFQNGGGALVTFWYQKNGVDVRWTNSRYSMVNNEYHAPNIPFQFDITNPATDNIRFMWYSDSTNTQIYSSGALTSPTRPSVPGIILNCQKVSEVTP